MPHLLEWLLILFQPVSDEKLRAMLQQVGMPEGDGILIGLYLFCLFLMMVLIRFMIRILRLYWVEGEPKALRLLALGASAAAAITWPGIYERISMFAAADEVLTIRGYDIPSFHLVHRALLPFDILGIKDFMLEGYFDTKLRLSLFFWQEDSRGLYVYPVLLALFFIPGLRSYTIPMMIGAFVSMCLLPLVMGSFIFSSTIGLGMLAVLYLGSGGIRQLKRMILPRR